MLALAELRGTLPRTIIALGAAGARGDVDDASPPGPRKLDQLVRLGASTLRAWDVHVRQELARRHLFPVRDHHFRGHCSCMN